MQVADDRSTVEHRLPFQGQHQAQDSMRAWVLWPQIQQHLLCAPFLTDLRLRITASLRILSFGCSERCVLIRARDIALLFDFLAQFVNPLDERFWARGTAGHVYINGDYGIDALHGVIAIVELAAGVGALSHADDPFGF